MAKNPHFCASDIVHKAKRGRFLPALLVLSQIISPLYATQERDFAGDFSKRTLFPGMRAAMEDVEREGAMTREFLAGEGQKVLLAYSEQRVSGYVMDQKGTRPGMHLGMHLVKSHDMPRELLQITSPAHFEAFTQNVYARLRLMGEDVSFSLHQRGLGSGRLHDAAYEGDDAGLTKLLEDPTLLAQINIKDEGGETSLHCAVLSGSLESVRTLLDHNADIIHVNARGLTPLSLALEKKNIPVAQHLTERLESLWKNLTLKELLSDTPALVATPLVMDHPIPAIAQGYEYIYRRFLKGVLIYKPYWNSEPINLPIAALANPLEGEFDLSACGDTGKYLSINTGYRKEKRPENDGKVEIWFTPRFLIEKELKTTAKHFEAIFPKEWPESAPVGIIWTRGGWDKMEWFDYLTNQNMDALGTENLYKKWGFADLPQGAGGGRGGGEWMGRVLSIRSKISCFYYELK